MSGALTAPAASKDASRCPTEKQYRLLRNLGSGSAWLSARPRDCEPLLRRGWVTGERRGRYYQFVRITPEGLCALALAVTKFGLPELAAKVSTHVEVCSECGRDWRPSCRCGSRQYRYEERSFDTALPDEVKA